MKKFTKIKEDFVCENCGTSVEGNGFTNHCPKCFFSKHVDINPGDRNCNCGSLMAPINISQKNGDLLIVHKCIECGFERKNIISENDDKECLFDLMKKLAEKGSQYLIENAILNAKTK